MKLYIRRKKGKLVLLLVAMLFLPGLGTSIVGASASPRDSVQIIDSKGRSIENTEIQVYDASTNEYLFTAYTDSNGKAYFRPLANREYLFSIFKRGYGYTKQVINILRIR